MPRLVLLLLLSLGIPNCLLVVANPVDSLKQLLQKEQSSLERKLELHFQLIAALKVKGSEAEDFINKALLLSQENGFVSEEALAKYYRGVYSNKKRIFNKATFEDLQFADSIAHQPPTNNELIIKTGKAIGRYFLNQQVYKKAIAKTQATLDFAQAHQLEAHYASLSINLGLYLGLDNQFFKAIDLFQQALHYPNARKANIYWNLADLSSRLEDWEQVVKYADLSIEVAQEKGPASTEYMSAMIKSNALLELKQYDQAAILLENYIPLLKATQHPGRLYSPYSQLIEIYQQTEQFEKIQAIEQEIPNPPYPTAYAPMANALGRFYLKEQQLTKAIGFCENGKKLSVKNMPGAAPWVMQSCDCLYKAYSAQGNFKAAFEHLKRYQEAKDILNEKENIMNLSSALNKQELAQQENILKLEQEKKEALHQATLSKYKTLGIIGGLLLLAALWIANLFRKRNQKIAQQNQFINKALREKDILLREIHHRVKNNLQLVSSLLGLQSRHVEDPSALHALNSGKARVKSMALIHQDLYNRENLTEVSVKSYFTKLCNELLSTYQIDENQIQIQTAIDDLQLDVDTLVPLGLIINELLTNALKYAFPDGRAGTIDIRIYEANGQLQLYFADDGIGMDQSKRSANSFGYRLINTLLHQLEGEMTLDASEGTQLRFSFSEYKKAA